MSEDNQIIVKDFKQWADDFSQLIITKMFEFIENKTANNGPIAPKIVQTVVLSRLVGGIIFRALMEKPPAPCSKEQLYEFTKKSFLDVRRQIEEGISAGFSGAMKTYSGQEMEYYCQVRPVPQPANKEPA